jgi:hypothetical protein
VPEIPPASIVGCDEYAAGVRSWPMLRRPETKPVAEVRETLGRSDFDQAFAAGTGLSQPHAAAAARAERSSDTRAA